jgi:hypothetical protein
MAKFHNFLRQILPCLQVDEYAGMISRELWWMNQDFSLFDIILPWFYMLRYHRGMNNMSVGGSSSET